jgi:ABC-2 type transport system permease protein
VSLFTGPIFGGLFDLPKAVMNISPFTHLPVVFSDEVKATPIVIILAVAAAFTIAGLAAFRCRSLSL